MLYDDLFFEECDKKLNIDDLNSIFNKSSEPTNSQSSKPPHGEYDVVIGSLILTTSKAGNQMLRCRYDIVNGKYAGESLYMYQLITNSYQVSICNRFLSRIAPSVPVIFSNFNQYADVLKNVLNYVRNREFSIRYSFDNNGYPVYTILESYIKSEV